jgi:hypothetical protein
VAAATFVDQLEFNNARTAGELRRSALAELQTAQAKLDRLTVIRPLDQEGWDPQPHPTDALAGTSCIATHNG